jgi:outer membrane protein
MKEMKRTTHLIVMFLFLLAGTAVQAQKLGHINSGALLAQLPDVQKANSQLEIFQKQKVAKGEQMVKAFQEAYQSVSVDVQSGKLSPVQQQQKEAELQGKQDEIQKYQQEVENEIMKKREELFQPIIDKVNNAIRTVGDENGYEYILDTTQGTLLFAKDSNDITPLVKKKLGL